MKDNTINSMNNRDKNSNNINQSLKDLFIINKSKNKSKNDIISIHSTKNDLSSIDSNFRNDNLINQSLNKLVYGNKNKNDIISINSNFTLNETNKETESVNQSLLNLVTNKNDIISLKSNNDLMSNKGFLNLQEMFDDFEKKSRIEEINKKIAKSGFIHLYDDNKKNKENKHVQIMEECDNDEGEKLYIYKNNGVFNQYKKMELPKKKVINEAKYYDILLNNNRKINNKVHRSNLFQQRNNKKK